MTDQQIIDMAKAAGFVGYEIDDGTTRALDPRFGRLILAAITAERKRCMAVCKERAVYYQRDDDGPDGRNYVDEPADEREGVVSRRSGTCLYLADLISYGRAPVL